jgi:drug/metabolite transporter (DMT)-like permease
LLNDPRLLALVSSFFFGLALVLTQFGLRHLPPRLGLVTSVPVATLLLWIVAPPFIDWSGWNVQAAAVFGAVGVLFPASVTLLTYEANKRMGPAVAGALGNLAPLFAVAIAVSVLGEELGLLQAAGLALVVVGVLALMLERRWLDASWPAWAVLLPLLAAAIRGAAQPAVKLGLALWPSALAAILCGYTVSSLIILGIAGSQRGGALRGMHRNGVLWFMCVGLCNACAVLTMYAALARGPVMLVSPLIATYPLFTLMLAWILLRNANMSGQVAFGVAMAVAGVGILIVS